MIWVQITTEKVLEHMPTDVRARYDLWLDAHPEKEGRLATITANTIREFRDGIKSNPANIYHPDETYLPQSAVRHCENIIIYTLSMEMGLPMTTTGNSARTAADVFLRQIPFGRWNTTTEDAGAPSPRWTVPERSDIGKRALPAVLVFFLLVTTACASWISPARELFDWQILSALNPTSYTNPTTTVEGHLRGIDSAIGSRATYSYVDSAIAAIVTTNTVDPVARALAENAALTAGAAITALPNYLPLSGGDVGPLLLPHTNRLSVGRSQGGGHTTIHFQVFQGYQGSRAMPFLYFRDTLASVPVSTGMLYYTQGEFRFNRDVLAPAVRSDTFIVQEQPGITVTNFVVEYNPDTLSLETNQWIFIEGIRTQ